MTSLAGLEAPPGAVAANRVMGWRRPLALLVLIVCTASAGAVDNPFRQFAEDMRTNFRNLSEFLSGSSDSGAEPESAPADQAITPPEPSPAPAQAEPRPKPPALDPVLVGRVQNALAVLGYDPGPTDGLYGPQTRAALMAYSRDRDGVMPEQIDGALVERLEAQAAAATEPPAPTESSAAASAALPEVQEGPSPEPIPEPETAPPESSTAASATPIPSPDADTEASSQTGPMALNTLGIELGMTMSEARALRPQIAFSEVHDPLGIKRLLPNGELTDVSYLATEMQPDSSYAFRAEPFGERVYAILREDQIEPPVTIEEMRRQLREQYGTPRTETPSRACWGNCDPEARILKAAPGVSLVADFPAPDDAHDHLRLFLWSGDLVRAARAAADEEVAKLQPELAPTTPPPTSSAATAP